MPGIFLLGKIEYRSDDGTALDVSLRRKTRALLGYLCLVDRTLTREHLAAMFCSRSRDPLGSLRWHISRIRREFHEGVLLVEEDRVGIDGSVLWIDARAFARRLADSGQTLEMDEAEETLRLYRGDVLAGCTLPGETEFELWLLGQRARYARLFEREVLDLVERLAQRAEYERALAWARRIIEHNSTLEDGHYWLMWLYARTGRSHIALQQYDVYQQHMLQELGANAGERLAGLRRQIARNELPELVVEHHDTQITAPTAPQALFVGRRKELARLQERWQDVAGGRGGALMLHGVAGIGKSTLIKQFLHRLPRSAVVHAGTCYESIMSLPLAPWIGILRSCLPTATSSADLPEVIRSRLSLLVPDLIPLDPAARRMLRNSEFNVDLLLNTVADFFSLLAAERPLVIVLEDFHFADQQSIQLFSLLLHRLHQLPLLLLATRRPIETGENPALQGAIGEWRSGARFEELELSTMDEEAVRALVDAIIPHLEDSDLFRKRLVDHTLGVSLHMLEVLHSCRFQPSLLQDLPVPATFAALVVDRLRKMTESQRQLLENLAVIEYPVTLEELLQCSGHNELSTIHNLEQAIQQRFVDAEPRDGHILYGFRHYLYRDVIIEQISAARRQLLHRRAMRLFQRQAAALPEGRRAALMTRIIYHARHAGDIDALIRWVPLAVQQARNRFGFRQAMELCEILDGALCQRPIFFRDEHARILLEMVELLRFLGDWKAQAKILRRLEGWFGDGTLDNPELRLTFLVEYGTNLFRSGAYEQAVGYLEEARARAEKSGDDRVVAQAVNSLGNIAYYQSRWDSAEAHYTRALELRGSLKDEVGVAKGYNNLGAVAYHRGDLERAAELYGKNLAIRERVRDLHGIATGRNNLGTVCMVLGRWDEANEHFRHALDIRRELDDQHGIASTLINLAHVSAAQGRHYDAIAYHQESITLNETIDNQAGLADTLNALGTVYIKMGDGEAAINYLEQSLPIYRKLKHRYGIAQTLLNLSYVHVVRQGERPGERFAEALQIAHDIDSNYLQCYALEIWAWHLLNAGNTAPAARITGLLGEQKVDRRSSLEEGIGAELRSRMVGEAMRREIERGTGMDLRKMVEEIRSELGV